MTCAQSISLGESNIVLAVHELQRRNAALGLATLGVSGGMGMAIAIEKCG